MGVSIHMLNLTEPACAGDVEDHAAMTKVIQIKSHELTELCKLVSTYNLKNLDMEILNHNILGTFQAQENIEVLTRYHWSPKTCDMRIETQSWEGLSTSISVNWLVYIHRPNQCPPKMPATTADILDPAKAAFATKERSL